MIFGNSSFCPKRHIGHAYAMQIIDTRHNIMRHQIQVTGMVQSSSVAADNFDSGLDKEYLSSSATKTAL